MESAPKTFVIIFHLSLPFHTFVLVFTYSFKVNENSDSFFLNKSDRKYHGLHKMLVITGKTLKWYHGKTYQTGGELS